MRKSIVGGLLQKWKNKHVLCQKFPAIEGRPESSKWSLQQLAVGEWQNMHGLNTKKNHLEAQNTTEYIAVLLNPGCRLTLHVCIEKEHSGCLMLIPFATEIAVGLNRA